MSVSTTQKVQFGFAIALLMLLGIGYISYHSTTELIDTAERVSHTHEVLTELESISSLVADAQRSTRGFILTGDTAYLAPFNESEPIILNKLNSLAALTADNSVQQQHIQKLKPLVLQQMGELKETIRLREKSFEEAAAQVKTGASKRFMDQVNGIIDQMQSEEKRLLRLRNEAARNRADQTKQTIAVASALAVILAGVATILISREMSDRKRAEGSLQAAHSELQVKVNDLQQRSKELRLLSEMSELLQSCTAADEAYAIIGRCTQQLFPDASGGLYITRSSKNLLESVVTFGNAKKDEFTPEDCWGLRRGREHIVDRNQSSTACKHLPNPAPASYLCMPMMAQGESLGVMHLAFSANEIPEATQRLVVTVSESIALALANLKLRETLRNQAIRDGLTGVFNRRYMEESLEREVRRALRHKSPLSVIMIDIDHFKRFNDTFGHAAGDTLLRDLGVFLKDKVRAEDIACRYGGEEFALIMPDASLQNAVERAELLRDSAKKMQVKHQGQLLGTITLSIGVSVLPEHGTSPEELLSTADKALYEAKRSGRDRVVVGKV